MFNQITTDRFKFSLFNSASPFVEQVVYITKVDDVATSHVISAHVTRNPLQVVDGQGENDIWVEFSSADLDALAIIPIRGRDQITLKPNENEPATKTYTIQKVISSDITGVTLGLNR